MSDKANNLLFDSFPCLETDRFQLIQINSTHVNNIFDLYSDKKVTKYFDLLAFETLKESEETIHFYEHRYLNNEGIRWGIAFKESSEIIGTLGFNRIITDHKAKLGYDLQSKYWGKGYMKEALDAIISYAFEELNIHRIEAEVMQGNIGSERLLSKLNFTKEGILRKWMYWNDQYFDISMFSLLKGEK